MNAQRHARAAAIAGLFSGLAVLDARAGDVHVNAGQVLTAADLLAGEFEGQPFTLGPSTRFIVNAGGQLGPLDALPPDAFDFAGSTVILNAGASARSNLNPGGGYAPNGLAHVTFEVLDDSDCRVFQLDSGSHVNLNGGALSGGTRVAGGQLVVAAGLVGDGLAVTSGSVLIAGGAVGRLAQFGGGEIEWAGGVIGRGLSATHGTRLTIRGGEFRLDDAAISELGGGLPAGGVLTGTLADGKVFVLARQADEALDPNVVWFDVVTLPPADPTPLVVSTGPGPAEGLRPGQTLTLAGDATLRADFAVVGATLVVTGGQIGAGLELARSDLLVSGGTIGADADAFAGTRVTVTGGQVGRSFEAFAGSEVEIFGGAVERSFRARSGALLTIAGGSIAMDLLIDAGASAVISGGDIWSATVSGAVDMSGGTLGDNARVFGGGALRVTGGEVGRNFRVFPGGALTIAGGAWGAGLSGYDGCAVTLRVADAALDGAPLALVPGIPVEITERNGATLGVTLVDGTPMTLVLNTTFVPGEELFQPDATLAVVLSPAACPGDADGSGLVDFGDLLMVLGNFGTAVLPGSRGDLDENGTVELRDLLILLQHFGAAC